MEIEVSGIKIKVTKKKIKNLHLSVMPPDGFVRISVPESVSDESILFFARSKISWIKKQQEKFKVQLRQNKREFVSGETLYIWGKQYFLTVKYNHKNDFKVDGNLIILTIRKDSTAQQRENYVNEVLRNKLKLEIAKRMPKWESQTGLKCKKWLTKNMKTHWGSYSKITGNITLNLQLVKKPLECLDYIIVHELGHTKYANHGKEFTEYMDKNLPMWREIKKALNEFTLDYV